jgi:hypothetical protein
MFDIPSKGHYCTVHHNQANRKKHVKTIGRVVRHRERNPLALLVLANVVLPGLSGNDWKTIIPNAPKNLGCPGKNGDPSLRSG